MIYHNPGYCMGNRSRREKFLVALGILANPWMLLLDKLGLAKHPTYQTRTGMSFQTRGQTTDINDAVVVLSGKEYPPELMGLEDSRQQYNDRPRVVLDCGGHIGTFSMYVKSHWPLTKIFAMFKRIPFFDQKSGESWHFTAHSAGSNRGDAQLVHKRGV